MSLSLLSYEMSIFCCDQDTKSKARKMHTFMLGVSPTVIQGADCLNYQSFFINPNDSFIDIVGASRLLGPQPPEKNAGPDQEPCLFL